MILRSQASPPSENTRSRTTGTCKSAKPPSTSTPRRNARPLHDKSNRQSHANKAESVGVKDQTMLDLRAAAECKDQAHIYDDPAWKVMDLDINMIEDGEGVEMEQGDGMLDVDDDGNLRDFHYKERYEVTLYQLSTEEQRWVDMGPGVVTLESGMYASRAIVHMDKTHRILAHWNVFGGMKVVRFLTTVIVVVISSDEDAGQKVVSYGLKVPTLQEARDLAILLSSNTHGMQLNFERIIPKTSAEQRAKILENMTDRLIVLQRRLGVSGTNSELSAQVESELAALLSMGVELTP